MGYNKIDYKKMTLTKIDMLVCELVKELSNEMDLSNELEKFTFRFECKRNDDNSLTLSQKHLKTGWYDPPEFI